jgi:hypothetical protein
MEVRGYDMDIQKEGCIACRLVHVHIAQHMMRDNVLHFTMSMMHILARLSCFMLSITLLVKPIFRSNGFIVVNYFDTIFCYYLL